MTLIRQSRVRDLPDWISGPGLRPNLQYNDDVIFAAPDDGKNFRPEFSYVTLTSLAAAAPFPTASHPLDAQNIALLRKKGLFFPSYLNITICISKLNCYQRFLACVAIKMKAYTMPMKKCAPLCGTFHLRRLFF